MARQHIDYITSALNPPHAPVDDDLDVGDDAASAIRPVADGEPAQADVFERPSENLRTRTEIVREELEQLKFMADADKSLLLTSTGDVTWNGIGPGTFVPTADLILKPFLAPNVSTASRLIICAGTQSQLTFRTRQTGLPGHPRAYSGANNITIDFRAVDVGTGAIVVTATGADANRVHIQYDSNAITYTTAAADVLTGMVQQFNVSAVAVTLGLEAVYEGNGVPAEVGFPTPPAFVAASKIDTYITVPEKATRYMAGAAEAEKHIITAANLAAFFAADGGTLNKLIEGDVLCVWYDEMVDTIAYGGRRQSITELPENAAVIPSGSLFVMRRFPARLPGALPIAAVVDGKLIFVNGRAYISGEVGPLVLSGNAYQGSNAAPNSWADGTVVAGVISFEDALDTIIQTLGTKTGVDPGAIKVGFTPAGNIAANTVDGALKELDVDKANLVSPYNVFTNENIFLPSTAATTAISATGNTTGHGVQGTGGASNGTGVRGTGGATNGFGVYGEGSASGGVGVRGVGKNTSAGVEGIGGPTNGIGVYAEGKTLGAAVKGLAGTNTSIAGNTDGISPAEGPGTGVVGFGAVGAGGGDGGQFFGRTGVGSTIARGGVLGTGSWSQTTGVPSGIGGYFTGGSGNVGVSDGGAGLQAIGGTGIGGGAGGIGVLGNGTASASGVRGKGGTNAGDYTATDPVNAIAGPATGTVGVGGDGAAGGDGMQAFARSTASARTGIVAYGNHPTGSGVPGGWGGILRGGTPTGGAAANGGVGLDVRGGDGVVTGQGQTGVNAVGGNGVGGSGGGFGLYAAGGNLQIGGYLIGGATTNGTSGGAPTAGTPGIIGAWTVGNTGGTGGAKTTGLGSGATGGQGGHGVNAPGGVGGVGGNGGTPSTNGGNGGVGGYGIIGGGAAGGAGGTGGVAVNGGNGGTGGTGGFFAGGAGGAAGSGGGGPGIVGSLGNAIEINAGHAYFSGGNVGSTYASLNKLTPSNIVKSWGTITSGATPALVEGYNLDATTPVELISPNNLRVNFHIDLADGSYVVLVTGGGALSGAIYTTLTKLAGSFRITGYNCDADDIIFLDTNVQTIHFVVIGNN